MRELFSAQYRRLLWLGEVVSGHYRAMCAHVKESVHHRLVPHATLARRRSRGLLYKLRARWRRKRRPPPAAAGAPASSVRVRPLAAGLALTAVAAAFAGGYHFALSEAEPDYIVELRGQIRDYRETLARLQKVRADEESFLVRKVALLQAQVVQMEAFGEHLAERHKLKGGAAGFFGKAGVGGALDDGAVDAPADRRTRLGELSGTVEARIEDARLQLAILSQTLEKRSLKAKRVPHGWPVNRRAISSHYGYRTSPFNGRLEFHRGIDIPGRTGTPVNAVAAGIVERTGYHRRYGNLVELRHADGYRTLYAHNQHILVTKGDMVGQGQLIALLGNTGRSTGPHVHFEVIKNGRRIDPKPFLFGSRK